MSICLPELIYLAGKWARIEEYFLLKMGICQPAMLVYRRVFVCVSVSVCFFACLLVCLFGCVLSCLFTWLLVC